MDKCILPILGGSRPQRKPAKVRKGKIFPHLSWNTPSSPWPPPPSSIEESQSHLVQGKRPVAHGPVQQNQDEGI